MAASIFHHEASHAPPTPSARAASTWARTTKSTTACLHTLGILAALLVSHSTSHAQDRAASQSASPSAIPSATRPTSNRTPQREAASTQGPTNQFEVGTFWGVNWVNGEPQNYATAQRSSTMGVDAALTLTLRTPYFLDPFIDASYAHLSVGETDVVVPPATTPTEVSSRLFAWNFAIGPGIDWWRFRFRVGVGMATVVVNHEFAGQENTANSLSLSSMISCTADLITVPRFRTGIEARLVTMPGADLTYWAAGLTFRGDVLQW